MNYQQQLTQSQAKQIFKEEAIPLISFEPQSRKYIVNEEAIEFLSKVPGPLAVVSVAGMYRTGKSYLLNRMLLNRQTGFGIGPSINPCTKGLWVWGKPLIGQTQEGDTVNIIVIDSEGIGALEEDSQHDNIVFALTILLSSCFIYNSIGNIDETAIQNLSLIVNLTKNIHIKSHYQNEEVDSEDYALYMPQFIWVVRDFSLQLVDSEGQDITSKEYLERALAIQKGFSDSVEQKNRIRRLLTTFFKERDCSCLVRPLTSEENLQNLDNVDFEQLRPEFFEQVITLRKRILNRIKVKTVNNKSLNGEMFVGLLQNYVRSINEGACPNIENAWSYICKNECIKAQYEAFDSYDKFTKEVLSHKIPTLLEEMKIYHKIAKDNAKQIYQKKSMGDVSNEYYKQLLEKIKQRFNQIKNENEKESQRACINFINQEFLTIEKKIKNYEYKQYSDFERDTKLFYSYFMDNGPKTMNKQLILLEFLQKAIFDGSHYFIRRIIEESELQKLLKNELQNKLEQQINDAREDGQREKNSLLIKIAQLETEKAEVEVREQCLKESLSEIQNEKERNERNLKSQYENEKSELERIINDLQQKLMSQEERVKELERQEMLQESEKEKEKALLVQKLNFLEKSLGEFHKKEKTQTDELKTTKKQYGIQIKEVSVKYEQQTKQLQNNLNELQEKLLEIENELATKEQKFDMERKKWKITETNFQQTITDQTEKIQQLSEEIKEGKQNEEKNADVLKLEQVKNYEQQSVKLKEQEIMLKEKEEALKNSKANSEKDKAVYQQKLEFLELQLRETKQQLVENKKNHEIILKALESSNNNEMKQDNQQVTEMTENHKKEIKNLESEFEQAKKRMLSQISSLNEKNNDLELKFKLEMSDKMKEIENLQDQLEQSERARIKLLDQNKNLDTSKLKLLKESEERYKQKIDQLEEQIEELKSRFTRETKEIQQKSEEQLAQLKNFYELERERLEKKLVEEKLKADKKFSSINDEFDVKLRDEQQNYEEELESLKEELREQELQSQSIIQQYEHELALKTQTIETLEKYVKETRESIMNIQNTHNVNIEQQLSSFNLERKQLMNKIDSIQIELTKKDKELMVISQRKDQIEQLLSKKEQTMEQFKMELQTEKQDYNSKLEESRQKLSALNDEFLSKKIEFGREIALSNQQNEFLTKKMDDLQKQLADQQSLYEEKLKSQKQDFIQELEDKITRAEQEKLSIQDKYTNTKKNLKQIEGTYNQQLSQLEKDKAICLEKLTHIETKKNETEQRLQNEIISLQNQLSKFKENLNNDKNSQNIQLEKYKQKLFDVENEKNEVFSNYERDRALWEGKFQFLEQQKDQLKQELSETKKNFEMTVNYLNKIKNEKDKNDKDVNVNQVVKQLEEKYAGQIKETEENYQQQITKLQEKIQKLQKENKQISDKITLENHGKTENQLFTQKKIAEYQESEKKLQQEIELLKEERDQKILEYQKQIDQERENLRTKINGLEAKLKESESKKTQLFFEHEKDLAKWNMEKDTLQTKTNELQDQVDKLERKKDGLLRENERLKNDSRTSRKSMNLYCNTQVGNQLLGTGKSFLNQKNTHQSPLHKSTLSSDKNLQDITNLNSKLPPKGGYLAQQGFNSNNNSICNDKDNVSFQLKSTQDLLMNSEKEMTFGNGGISSMNNFESQNLLTSSSNDENQQN